MKKIGIGIVAIGLAAGIASSPADAQSAGHVLRGAGIGAAGGAVAGALIPGLGIGEGALIGGAGGAAYNGLIDKGRRHDYNRHGHRYGHHRDYRHHYRHR